jgi:hypothetical protein
MVSGSYQDGRVRQMVSDDWIDDTASAEEGVESHAS